ncbi:MAG: ABC transporter permease subunit, partial [Gammaproteobacteria bacterium]
MVEILIQGAVSSAIYALLAVGFTLIFGVARILNLAHGSFYALGAYGTYLLTSYNWPLLPSALISIAFVALFGVVMERVLVRPMRRRSLLAVLMIT